MKVTSPVTNTENVSFVKNIETKYIARLYKESLGIDVNNFFFNYTTIGLYRCIESGLEFFSPPEIAGDEGFYKELEKIDWYYQDDKWEYRETKGLIKNTDKVLEVGCGKGAFLKIISGKCEQAVGLELNDNAVEYGKSQGLKIHNEFVQDHALRYPEYYDVACAFQVLEHIADINSFIQGCLASVKKNGLLIFAVPNNKALFFKEERLLPKGNAFYGIQQCTLGLNLPPHHMCKWNKKTLAKLSSFFDMRVDLIISEPLGQGRKFINDAIIKNVRMNKLPFKNIIFKFLRKANLINRIFSGYDFGDSLLVVFKKN